MSALLDSFDTSFWQHVFWTLLHSVWQAALIATLLLACLSFLPARRNRLRYALSYGALILVVLSSAVTHGIISNANIVDNPQAANELVSMADSDTHGSHHANSPTNTDSHSTRSAHSDHEQAADFSGGWVEKTKTVAKQWQPIAMALWLTIACVLLLRNLVAVARAGKLRASTEEAPPSIKLLFENLKAKLNCSNSTEVRLSKATSLLSPCVLGILRATIVIPAAMLTQLTSDEIEAVLAHEIAHVKRHDFLFNLVQLTIGSLYFFNPAVHFINRQIRSEREACCDSAAVKATSSDVAYAKTLSKFAEWIHGTQNGNQPAVAIGFAGSQKGKLLDRVSRLLLPEKSPNTISSAWGFLLVLLATFLVLASTSSGTKAIASYTSALIQESEVRAAEINEMKKENSPPGALKGTSTVVLRVLDEAGVPIDEGKVYIHSTSGPNGRSTYGSANSLKKGNVDHEFRVRAGTVNLLLDIKGFAPILALKEVELYADKTIEREVKLTQGESCQLKVVDSAGQPIENVLIRRHVKTSLMSMGGISAEFKTDAKGEVTVFNLDHDLIDYLSIWKSDFDSSKVKNLERDGVIEVTLNKTPLTRGIVVDHNGTPVPDAKIYRGSGSFSRGYDKPIATSDKDGKFETNKLSPGKYRLLIEQENNRGIVDGVVAGAEARLVLFKPRQIKVRLEGDLDLIDRERLRVTQNYYPDPMNNTSTHFEIPIDVGSDSDREFYIHGVVSGSLRISQSRKELFNSYEIENDLEEIVIDLDKFFAEKHAAKIVFECEGQRAYPQGTARLYRRSGSDKAWSESELVEIKDGEVDVMVSSDELNVIPEGMTGFSIIGEHGPEQTVKLEDGKFVVNVEPAGAIHGTVVNSKGKPLSTSVRVKLEFSDKSRNGFFYRDLEATSKTNGNFVITPIPLGTKVKLYAGQQLLNYWEEVELDSDQAVAEVALTVPESGSAKVRVTDADGTPLAKIPVNIRMEKIGFSHGFYTDDEGVRVFEELRVGEGGYQLKVLPNSDFQVPMPRPISTGDSIDIVLKKGHRLAGKVVDKDGRPVHEFKVKAIFGDRFVVADSLTNEQGEFTFTRLPNEPVTLQAAHRWEQVKSKVSKPFTPDKDGGIVLKVLKKNGVN